MFQPGRPIENPRSRESRSRCRCRFHVSRILETSSCLALGFYLVEYAPGLKTRKASRDVSRAGGASSWRIPLNSVLMLPG